MVAALGGPKDLMDRPAAHLAKAAVIRDAAPREAGVVTRIDVRKVGLAVLSLGGGRRHAADAIDFAVGLTDIVGIGEAVGVDRPLAKIHAADGETAAHVEGLLREAIEIGDGATAGSAIVREASAPPLGIRPVVPAPAAGVCPLTERRTTLASWTRTRMIVRCSSAGAPGISWPASACSIRTSVR
jgi:hypothetical protein